jgi:hypothetical protein
MVAPPVTGNEAPALFGAVPFSAPKKTRVRYPPAGGIAYTRLVRGSLVPSPHRGLVTVARKPALYNGLRWVVGLFTHPRRRWVPGGLTALTHS